MPRRILIAIIAMAAVLIVGIAIPKFTVRDLVPVNADFKRNVSLAVYEHYENPFERAALCLGGSRIVSATISSAEVESFTLFRIPLGVLRGEPGAKLSINFNLIGDQPADEFGSLMVK